MGVAKSMTLRGGGGGVLLLASQYVNFSKNSLDMPPNKCSELNYLSLTKS